MTLHVQNQDSSKFTRTQTLLTTRAIIVVLTMIVHTVWKTAKIIQLLMKMKTHKVMVLGIRRNHVTKAEQIGLNSSEMLFYSRHEEDAQTDKELQ